MPSMALRQLSPITASICATRISPMPLLTSRVPCTTRSASTAANGAGSLAASMRNCAPVSAGGGRLRVFKALLATTRVV
ncbi:hypothetical protein D3C80_1825040 [compost metagenome]